MSQNEYLWSKGLMLASAFIALVAFCHVAKSKDNVE